ncbi:IS110 family transposase [Chloroflexota bacterium]
MYFCGVDVAKREHTVLVVDNEGRVVQPAFSFDNNRAGFDQLAAVLAGLSEPVAVGLEATGHYCLALYSDLTQQSYPVTVINPLQIAAYRRSGIRKVKTDTADALWIADFLRIANLRPTDRDLPVILQLRELSRFRYWLSAQIGDCKRKILCILDRVFPEYETLFTNVFSKSSSALLKEAVSAQEIADFDLLS